MVSTSLPKANEKNIVQLIAERAERGWDLYLTKRQLISKIGEDTYSVPGSNGRKHYTVRYGGDVEVCDCADHDRHSEISCKHLVMVALQFAQRRRVHSTCQVCGKSSREKTLVGLRRDRRRDGERYCLPHHPESIAGAMIREVVIQGEGL